MKYIFKIRNKKTKEILPENHYLYMNVCVSSYGDLFLLYEDENSEGHMVEWTDHNINDEYEVVKD